MSKISVLKSNGQWSNPIYGLDKIHLMKSAIQREYTKTYILGEKEDVDFSTTMMTLEDLEIDTEIITTAFTGNLPVVSSNVNWYLFNKNAGVNLNEAKLLKMRLSTLQIIAKEEALLTPIYNALIKAAEILSPTPNEYCLLFKFEDE